ncbi:growth-regulating factor 3-like isoform X2 [Salvia splendens]|uniref:growth-regulating factor 3-like isoform X2 n=1 Tax=Salvia splendens TaxID=180675 RepID=UPI001C258D1A|nr:growth-regulating factor 3-like isoform X2 [Salvia splendens]
MVDFTEFKKSVCVKLKNSFTTSQQKLETVSETAKIAFPMDFNLKHWREESEEDEHQSSTKLPRLDSSSPAPALPLFVPQPQSNHYSTSATKLPRIGMGMGMGGGGSYFSWAQWQELELQALIFRHIMGGGGVPAELLHLVKNSLASSPLHYYHPSSSLGYWGGQGGMDPEPGRCRRTDGKKWRCSRDVVASQKYCHRHMHRGKNRSRKPVETPTPFTLSHPRRPETQPAAGDPTLRHFIDDWPTSLDDHAPRSATNLSISLKLGSDAGSTAQINWDGPLAELVRITHHHSA